MRHHIRWMIRIDMQPVLAMPHHEPWTEEDLLRALRERNIIGNVAEIGESVFGFSVYALHKTSLEILNIGGSADAMRAILSCPSRGLIQKLSPHRRNRITFNVRESDLALCLLLKSLGFEVIRIDRGLFGDEDGYHFVYRLPVESSVFQGD